ncbi:MAG: hypothetical protein ACREN2_01405 [Candidatus Dormibacteria bacterium]
MRISDRSNDAQAGYTQNPSYGLIGPAGVAATNDVAYFSWADSRAGSPGAPIEDYYFTSAQFVAAATTDATPAWVVPLIIGLEAAVAGAGIAMLLVLRASRRRTRSDEAVGMGSGTGGT